MAEQQTATCPQCSQPISPEDTIVFGSGALGHLDCRRPRVLSAEERTLLFLYCRDHPVAECIRCTGKFHLREMVDQFGSRSHGCRWCHTDLTDSIRAHLYSCTMLPAEVRRRAAAAREAARNLVKQSHQLRDTADVLLREAEVLLLENQWTLRRSLRSCEWQMRLRSYHPLPMKLQIGDRFSDETGEREIASPPRLTADGQSVHTRVRRVDQPAAVEDRMWAANDRIRVRRTE